MEVGPEAIPDMVFQPAFNNGNLTGYSGLATWKAEEPESSSSLRQSGPKLQA